MGPRVPAFGFRLPAVYEVQVNTFRKRRKKIFPESLKYMLPVLVSVVKSEAKLFFKALKFLLQRDIRKGNLPEQCAGQGGADTVHWH